MFRRSANQRLSRYGEILVRLRDNGQLAGGIRLETWILAKTFTQALEQFHQLKTCKIVELLKPATVTVKKLGVSTYLERVGEKLQMAEQVLRRGGVTRHRGAERLTNPQKQILGDLTSLFGYYTHTCYKTDPISPTTWWRTERRRRVQFGQEISSEDKSEKEEATPERGAAGRQWFNEKSDRALLELCRFWRREDGQQRIILVYQLFEQ